MLTHALSSLTPEQRLVAAAIAGMVTAYGAVVLVTIAQSARTAWARAGGGPGGQVARELITRPTTRPTTPTAPTTVRLQPDGAAYGAYDAHVAQQRTHAVYQAARAAQVQASDAAVRLHRLPLPAQFIFHQSEVTLATVRLLETHPSYQRTYYLSEREALLEPWCAIPDPLEPRWN